MVRWQDPHDISAAVDKGRLYEGGDGDGADGERPHLAEDMMCVETEMEQKEDAETQGSDCLEEEDEAAFLGDIAQRARGVDKSACMSRQKKIQSPAVDVGDVIEHTFEIWEDSKDALVADCIGKEACEVEVLDRVNEQMEEKQCSAFGEGTNTATPQQRSRFGMCEC